jgi:VIT1/CCC1 family predicted Fe2+/Mn2+ transporter
MKISQMVPAGKDLYVIAEEDGALFRYDAYREEWERIYWPDETDPDEDSEDEEEDELEFWDEDAEDTTATDPVMLAFIAFACGVILPVIAYLVMKAR